MEEHVRKSTPEDIRARFDADVERFSNLETGQAATIDAPLAMELVTRAAAACTPKARRIIDVGCGAGNYAIKTLDRLDNPDVRLIDLSGKMLERARERVSEHTTGKIECIQGDIRRIDLGEDTADIILAAAVLHHLRGDEEWKAVFSAFHRALRPGGGLWISDLITHDDPAVQQMMWDRYGEYLEELGGAEYRKQVFEYIGLEDSPRSLTWQLELMRRTGFRNLEVLHKNSVFAAFGGTK